MKVKKLLIFVLLLCIALFAMAGCSDTNSVEYITDMERFADMQETADSIEVKFDNHTGKSFKFTVEDENDITEIMNILLTDELNNIGKQFPPGDNTFITVFQGEKSYSLSVRINREKDTYYAFSTDKLQSKITDIAIKQGAYDTKVGVIYKVIDLQDIESVKEEKITVADKAAMLALLENSYVGYEYFYLYDSSNLAEQYYSSGITENGSAAYRYDDTVFAGKDKLLLMYHIYQNYNEDSYYITSPSLGEYADNGNTMYIEFAFGLWHNYYLHITVVS